MNNSLNDGHAILLTTLGQTLIWRIANEINLQDLDNIKKILKILEINSIFT